MSDTVKNLVYKVQSDFSDAEKGLDSFVEKMDQLVDKSNEVGRQIAEQIGSKLAKIPLPDLQAKLQDLFTGTDVDLFKGASTSIQNIIVSLAKVKLDMANLTEAGATFGATTSKNLDTVINQAIKLAQTYEKLKVAQEDMDTGKGDPKQFAKLQAGADKLLESLNAGLDKLAERKDIQLNFGAQALKDQLAEVGIELDSITGFTDKLNSGFKSISDNPFFKGTVSNQVKDMADQIKSLTSEQDKLEGLGKKVADAMAAINSAPGGIASGDAIAKGTEALQKYEEQASKVKEAQTQLYKVLGETSAVDKFMASLGGGTLDKAQGLFRDTSKSVLDLIQNLAKAGDQDGFERVLDQLPRFSTMMKQVEDQLQIIPNLMTDIRQGGVGGVDALAEAMETLVRSQERVDEQFKKMATSSEALKSNGITAITDQLNQAIPGIEELKQQMAGLIETQAQLQGNSLAKIFNPEGLKSTGDALLNLNKELDDTIKESEKVAQALTKMSGASAAEDVKKLDSRVEALNEHVKMLSDSMKSMSQVQSTTSAFGGLSEVMGDMGIKTALLAAGFFGWFTVIQKGMDAIKGIVAAGVDFQTQLTSLKIGTDLSAEGINKVADAAKTLSAATGGSLDGIIEGFKTAKQEGFDLADSVKIVTEATQSSVAAGADESKMISDLSRIMENYRIGASGVAGINNIIFEGAKAGAVPLQQYADGLTKVSATASAIRVSLPEAAAALSTLDKAMGGTTSNGQGLALMFDRMKVNLAQTQQVVAGINPELAKMFTPEVLQGPEGFTKVLQALTQVMKTNPEVARTMFGSFNAGGQAIVITNHNLESYLETLGKTNTAANSTSESQEALKERLGTVAGQWTLFEANMKVAATTVGTLVTPALLDVLKNLNDLGTATSKVYKIVVQFSLTNLGQDLGGGKTGDFIKTVLETQIFGPEAVAAAHALSTKEGQDVGKAVKNNFLGGMKDFFTDNSGNDNPIAAFIDNLFAPSQKAIDQKVNDMAGAGQLEDAWQRPIKDAAAGAKDKSDEITSGLNSNAQDVAAKIATSVSTIAKGIEDAMKLLSEAKNIQIPDNIEELIQPLATAVKKIYDTFANTVGNENNSTELQKIAQAISEEIKSVKDMAALFKDLPGINVSDPSGNIDKLMQAVISTSKSFSKMVNDSGLSMGDAAAGGEIAKSINEQITTIKNMAELYKNIPDANSIPAFADSINALVQGTVGLVRDFQNLTEEQKKVLATAIPLNENVDKLVNTVKNMAELYKALPAVTMDPSFPETINSLVQSTVAMVTDFSNLSDSQKKILESATPISDNVAKMVTVLKDVAELYKQLAGQDTSGIVDVSKITQQLAKTAAIIATQVEAALPPSAKAATEAGQVAEGVAKMVTLLKDTAELFKAAAEVDFSQNYTGPIQQLSASVTTVADVMLPKLSQYNVKAETELGTVAEGIGKQVNALKDVAGLLKDISSLDISGDYTGTIDKLAEVMKYVADEVARVVGGQGGSSNLNAFADTAQKEVKAVTDTVKLIGDLNNLPTINNEKIRGQIDQVVDIILDTINYFDSQLNKVIHSSEGNKIATDASNVFKSLADAVKVINDLQEMPSIDTSKMEGEIDKVIDAIISTLSYFDSHLVSIKNGGEIVTISKDADEVMKALGDTVKTIEDLMVLPKISDQKLKDGIDFTIQVMIAALKYFDERVQDMESNPLTTKIAEEIGKVMSTIDTTLKVFETLGTKKHLVMNSSSIKDAVDGAIGSAKYFIKALTDSGIDEGSLAQASKVAEEITKILDALDKLNGKTTMTNRAGKGGVSSSISHSGGVGGLSNLNSFLGSFGGSGEGEGDSHFSVPQVAIPRPPTFVPASGFGAPQTNFAPGQPIPGQSNKKQESDQPITLNTEVHLDGEVLAKSLGQKMFKGQTLRQNLVP